MTNIAMVFWTTVGAWGILSTWPSSHSSVLTGGMDDPKLQDGDEPNLSGPEDSVIGRALIRPLLTHV